MKQIWSEDGFFLSESSVLIEQIATFGGGLQVFNSCLIMLKPLQPLVFSQRHNER